PGIASDVSAGVVGDRGLGSIASAENIERIKGTAGAAGVALVSGIEEAATSDESVERFLAVSAAIATTIEVEFQRQAESRTASMVRSIADGILSATASGDVQATLAEAANNIANAVPIQGAAAATGNAGTFIPRAGGATAGPGAGGKFINPLQGSRVTSGFSEQREWGAHGGLDLNLAGNDLGAPILAAADGVVSRIRDEGNKGLGKSAEVTHAGGYITVYGHMLAHAAGLKVGQNVRQGQIIGFVGSTGNSTGPHLHFEVIKPGGKGKGVSGKVDPASVTDISGRFNGDVGGATGLPIGVRQKAAVEAQRDALAFLRDLSQTIKEAGGDLGTVLDAVFSGATELAADKLAGFSDFARQQMQVAFDAIRLVMEQLGPNGLADLRRFSTQLGLVGTPEENALRNEMRRGHPGFEALEALGNVQDRSALLSLVRFLEEHQNDPAFQQLLGLLASATEGETLASLRNRILTPAGDVQFDALNALLDRLGPALEIITAGQVRTLVGDSQQALAVGELLNLLRSTEGSGGFAGMLRQALLGGSTDPNVTGATVDFYAQQSPANDAASRRLLQFLLEQFGGGTTIEQLRKLLLDKEGKLLAPNFDVTPEVVRDPAARDAARRVRDFALSNQFTTDSTGERKIDPAITSVLKALQDSEAKTLDEFLKSPDVANILPDDSPLG
ncbi:MAG TPA: M23 family metallopeptidase, partial [Chloroflexia bacterium]|nr:M23 family metallopeptidase [Chloroflexia bacterium]